MVEMLTQLNLPLTAVDHFTQAVKLMFLDSVVANKNSCGQSQATASVKELAHTQKDELCNRMKLWLGFTLGG